MLAVCKHKLVDSGEKCKQIASFPSRMLAICLLITVNVNEYLSQVGTNI